MQTELRAEVVSRASDPHAEVELLYIAEYLQGKGYSLEDLAGLPAATAKTLREEASRYASLKLAEFEMGATLADTLHVATALEQTTIRQ